MANSGAGQQRWHFSPGTRAISAPSAADGGVYVSSGSDVYAVDAATGEQRWSFTSGSDRTGTTHPTVADSTVYFGTDHGDGRVYALDAATGHPRWKTTTGAPMRSTPLMADGTLYVGGEKGLHALDATTGHQRWEFTPCQVSPRPAAADGVLYVHAGQRAAWRPLRPGRRHRPSSTGGSPQAANGAKAQARR